METPKYSIVVPVYKSTDSLRELSDRISNIFQRIGESYEIIMVEDGGGTPSWEVMKSLRNLDPRVKIIRLTKNFGQHNALMCGFSFASGDYIITMDDDLQNPPEEIPFLINTIRESNFDVVYGIPKLKKHSFIRKIGSYIYAKIVSLEFKEIPQLRISNFRIIRKQIIELIKEIPTPNPLVGFLILKVTERIGSVTIDHHERKYGETTYNRAKLVQQFLHGILYHSTLPLKGVFYLGTAAFFLSIILGTFYLTKYLVGDIQVSGWTTIILLLLFFFGILMFSVGIIGEYLLRIIQEVRHSPAYLIREKEL